MNLFILTQTEEFVNVNNVLTIVPMEADAEDINTKEQLSVYTISAITVTGESIQLGVFRTEEEMTEVWDKIKKWIANSVYPLFEVPEMVE